MTTDLITTAADKSVELQVKAHTALASMKERAAERMRDQTGQISAEYLGLIVLVVAIVTAIVALELPDKISGKIESEINKITD